MTFVPVLLPGKEGRDDRQGRKDGRIFVCSLKVKGDGLTSAELVSVVLDPECKLLRGKGDSLFVVRWLPYQLVSVGN